MVRGNVPDFPLADFSREPFEEYSPLDEPDRCGPAYAMIGPDMMPDGKRGSIGMIHPSGWRVSKYAWVDGGYLYNRCHLIAFQLTGENEADGAVSADDSAIWKSGSKPIEPVVADSADAAAPPDATATAPDDEAVDAGYRPCGVCNP